MIRVKVSVVGEVIPGPEVIWPPTWPPPHFGEEVSLPGRDHMFVRVVDWYPEGNHEDRIREPFVYVVLGPRRPGEYIRD